ncbi:hypothetical protein GQF95_23130 (plasmid) [Escherichia coli]|nr:hypothetical protein GQF95_23130 [Escherichia coli]
MTHLNELYLILNKSLKWNKSHLKCFALIMLVIILKQTCNLSSASKALPIKCLPQSFYRRMQRFFAGQYFDYRQISQLIFNMFSFDQVQLTLDRTNWKWGKRNINILMLAIVYRGIAIPILWTLLNKRGNSDTKERIALIQRFIAIFGKDRIVNVFADREFIGEQWGTVAKLAMRQPFVLFKGLTFQKLCLPGAFRPGDHHNKMLRPGLCVVHASPQYL